MEQKITIWFEKAFKSLFMAVTVILFLALFAYLVMYLWNWLIPNIFGGVTEITYWQAAGLLVLSRILFGGIPGKNKNCCKHCKKGNHVETTSDKQNFREKFMRKWESCKTKDSDADTVK